MPTLSRRHFLAALPVAAALAENEARQDHGGREVRGHRDTMRGVDQQYQVNPLCIYDELRPAPYRDSVSPTPSHAPVSAVYLKIKTTVT